MRNDRVKIPQLLPNWHENSHNGSELAEQIAVIFSTEHDAFTSAFIWRNFVPNRAKRTGLFYSKGWNIYPKQQARSKRWEVYPRKFNEENA
jgi:hypothetical protein